MVLTRQHAAHPGPVRLRQLSAFASIRFTTHGRRKARKYSMNADAVHLYHFETLDGVTTYHVREASPVHRELTWTFRRPSDVPEHALV